MGLNHDASTQEYFRPPTLACFIIAASQDIAANQADLCLHMLDDPHLAPAVEYKMVRQVFLFGKTNICRDRFSQLSFSSKKIMVVSLP